MKKETAAIALMALGIGILSGCGGRDAVETDGTGIMQDVREAAYDQTGNDETDGVRTLGSGEVADGQTLGGDEADGVEKSGDDGTDDGNISDHDGDDAAKEPAGDRKLTAAELEEYTEWIRENGNYGFLLSEWDCPEQIDLMQVFYGGAGIGGTGTQEQKEAFLARYGQEEIYTDFMALEKSDVSAFLTEKVGLSYDELVAKGNVSLESIYYPETDSFCLERGDTNYCAFLCTDGVESRDGTGVTLYFEGDDWYRKCETRIIEEAGKRRFLCNRILEGMESDGNQAYGSVRADGGVCLIDPSVLDNLQTNADASAVENKYVLGDWSKITKEALQGTWYSHPKDMGEDTKYDVVLQFDGDDAIVFYPSVDFYGDARYEWDVVDRSDRGLCPELAVYWRGTKEGELAWYILGISDNRDYFWCNGEVFYRQ